jgi:hypothetical protein
MRTQAVTSKKKAPPPMTEPPELSDDPRVEMVSITSTPIPPLKRQAAAEEFKLEPPPKPGTIPPRVVDELRHVYRVAHDFAAAWSDAIKAQAEKHQIHPKALRRYIATLEGDKIRETAQESEQLLALLGPLPDVPDDDDDGPSGA